MNIALEVHWGFAFFVLFVALFVGWVQMGRRTMSGVIGFQILIGIILFIWMGIAHHPVPSTVWIHIVIGLAAMFAYIAGRRIYDRAPQNPWPAVGFSLLGFILVCATMWYGWSLVYPMRG